MVMPSASAVLSRLLAFKDMIDVGRRTPKIICRVTAIGQQAASFSEKAERINGRQAEACNQRCNRDWNS